MSSTTARRAAAWLLAAGLCAYIVIATRDWHLPTEGGVSFPPTWALVVAVGLLIWWWRAGRPTPVTVMAVAAVTGMLLTDVTSFWSQGLRDWHLYLKAGEHLLGGQPVYLDTLFTRRPDDLTNYPFLYPPPTLPLFALLSLPPRILADMAWLAFSIGAAAWAFRRLGVGWRWMLVFLVWPPFEQGIYVGNVAIPLFALFVAAPIFGAGLVVSAVFKLYSGVAVLWLPRERHWRDLAIGVGLVAAWALVTLPFVGIDRWAEWIRSLGLYRESQALLPGSLVGMGLARIVPDWAAIALGLLVVVLALRARGEEGLWRLGVATVIAAPSLYSHGYVMAVPAILRLRTAVLWLVLGITSVEPGFQWFAALGIVIASWYVPALRREAEPGGAGNVTPIDDDRLHPVRAAA